MSAIIGVAIGIVVIANLLVLLANENNFLSRRLCASAPWGLLFISNRAHAVRRHTRPKQYLAWDLIDAGHLV